ncbi:CoA transferase [Salinadaptatus halalkaliphilus]|uniref:CoA transferase n=1 Tax=Salinadaptatus halalkaliphilus TaxID=2419781 RepID=A0A4S3TM94_9EURY|nr:CoA transferase [Salinadaptatus halalkaliphilus]THE64125.1 CoA transferase [Salinadaptatus halalkaliphilus]
MATDTSTAPLEGVRVLDCTQMLAGPFATQLLADLGADVVKIERPGHGDITRSTGPDVGDSGLSAYFSSLNRGKRSVELDLSSEDGAAAFACLAADADVLVENYRPGTMAKWGLGDDDVRTFNEEIVYCSISGFLEGPYRDLPAFDMVAQALSGSMSITGQEDGPPMRPGIAIGDICAGMYAVVGVVTSLYGGGGEYVEVPMFEGLVSWLTERAGRTFATGKPYPRLGTTHPTLAPYQTFETADGWFAVAIASDGTWQSFCTAIDRPDLLEDQRFTTNNDRVEHREELVSELEPLFRDRTNAAWFETFRQHGLPGAPVKNTHELFEDEHIRESGILDDELTIGGEEFPYPRCPIDFAGGTTRSGHTPPQLGEHTESVLSEVVDDATLARIVDDRE